MEISLTNLGTGVALPTWTFDDTDFDYDGSRTLTLTGCDSLPAGRYRVGFTLYREADNSDERAGLNAILHVYHNMESRFEHVFTNSHFNFSVSYILSAWTGTQWNFANDITGWHFYFLDDIYGIDGNNFAEIVQWFNTLTNAGSPATVPASPQGLGALIDAALIGIAGADVDFRIANYGNQAGAEEAISGLVRNSTAVTFDWTGSNTVTITVSGIYELDISFLPGLPVQGADLVAQLAWLRTNAQNGGSYLVEIRGNETIAPSQSGFPFRSNLTITLRGYGGIRSVNLSANGSLFTVGSGVTRWCWTKM